MKPKERGAARALGMSHYTTGRPCKRGHFSRRNTKSGRCLECVSIKNKDNPRHTREYMQNWRNANREHVRNSARKRMGLPEPTRPCPARCECCNGSPVGRGSLHLDHDHETGKFRGWICSKCNVGIGSLGDNLIGVLLAAVYLGIDSQVR